MASEPKIHQYIFAGPKPGLSAAAFQSYWVNFHAVDYAAKIPQIRRYLVATREPADAPRPMPFFEGVAEIWLENDEEQIASLQSHEFLHGAREDEPRWAAFWQTFVIDTESRVLKPGVEAVLEYVNAYILVKRKPGMDLCEFAAGLETQARAASANATMRRATIGLARAGSYGFGEPRFDGVVVYSFDTAAEAGGALADIQGWQFAEPNCVFGMVGREHWIIRPEER
jgi:hypothetical protein